MKTIIATSVYSLKKHPDMGYAVFKKTYGFCQQVSKWYSYKGNAIKVYKEMICDGYKDMQAVR